MPPCMSLYQQIAKIGPRFFSDATLFKYGFNLSPMYRRTTARITAVSDDLMRVAIRLPISYKNRNYVGSIFGGSLFASVDPIPMVQLINILDSAYIVWDKAAAVRFKAPAREDLYAVFEYTPSEIEQLIATVEAEGETEIVKTTRLTNRDGSRVFCEVDKTIYVATKAFFKQKRQRRAEPSPQT
ncbi:MAG: DUF4442 domain-containing protein [Bacteroidota bacterium]